jgi:hypothetical protein
MCIQTNLLTSFAHKCGQKMMFETYLTSENIQFVARATRERMRMRSDAGRSGATTLDAILDDLRLSPRIGWSWMDEQKRNRRATASLFQVLGWGIQSLLPLVLGAYSVRPESILGSLGQIPRS